MLAIACSVWPVLLPSDQGAATNSRAQLGWLAMQAATMLASELNVVSVDVAEPFGRCASTGAISPVVTSTMLPTIAAALRTPTRLPKILGPLMNCAKA